MCGIFGTTRPIADDQLNQVVALLNHRGPDSNGRITLDAQNRPLTLAHTRLAIQDLSPNGHQPMASHSGRWVVTFNGEIYNHHDLRKNLSVPFRGTSDTETLVESIATIGIDKTIKQLNGIFGFAAYDRQENLLYIVRDPYGIKPVYYAWENEQLSFASEIKPLQLLVGKTGFNLEGLSLFLTLRYTPSPDTLLKGIKRLSPGHCLVLDISKNQLSTYCYSASTPQKFMGSIEDAVEQYNFSLSKAVKRQLLSDVPVGILLSGGIDSALVASYAREHSGITGYTVGFGDRYADCEIADAKSTADALGISHKHITIEPETLINDLPAIVKSVEEPLGTTSIMAMWNLSQLAKHDVTVALTGQGSDEPWGGYRRYKIEHLIGLLPLLASPLVRMPDGVVKLFKSEAIKRGVGCLGEPDLAKRFKLAYQLFDEAQIHSLLPNATAPSEQRISQWINWLPKNTQLSSAEKMMRIDTRMNLADDLLLYGDKISMAFALETRVPMLDTELMSFVESLPIGYRSNIKSTKIVHKLTARRFLPSEVVERKKKGFLVPFGQWSKTVWKKQVEEQLLDQSNPMYGAIQHSAVEKLWKEHIKGTEDLSKQLFALYTLSLWSNDFL